MRRDRPGEDPPEEDRAHSGATPRPEPAAWRWWLLPALLAVALVAAAFLLQARIDFNVADEGFQWYGAIATAHGQVPLRDFSSYDPGRYYWAAAWSPLFGDGILALRLSTAVFQAIGLFLGLLAARRAVACSWCLAVAGVLLLVWMTPRHKLFEPSIAMAAVWVGVRLLERPSRGRHFAAGLLAGLAAIMGKNLGLYCLVALLCLALIAHRGAHGQAGERRPLPRRLGAFAAGLGAGLLPLLVMFAIPGFFASFVESFLFFIRQGRTNFPVPFPWPWQALASGLDRGERLQQLSLGLAFLLLGCGTAIVLGAGWRRFRREGRVPALLVAGGVVGACFLHHAFSRTEAFHLAQSIHPLLLAAFALPAGHAGGSRRLPTGSLLGVIALAGLIVFITLFTAVPQAPLFNKLSAVRFTERFVSYDLAGDEVYVRLHAARLLDALRYDFTQVVPREEPALFAAHFPGLYALLGRRSPVWEIFPIWPAVGGRDERMLRELRQNHVRWALIGPDYKETPEDLSFAQTHPKVWSYLMAEFERVPSPELPRRFFVLRKRQAS